MAAVMRRDTLVWLVFVGLLTAAWLMLAALLFSACDTPPAAVLNRPLGNCLEMQDLLRNRPYPPKHGKHSYAKPVPLCSTD